VKYAASGGWIRVRAESAPRPNGAAVRISVEDRGPGIGANDLPHIFDPFYRSEAVRNSQLPGVGLGLSLVRRIVEAHKGTIEVRSAPESGASFFIDLPADATATLRADGESSLSGGEQIKEVAS
jgi:two-component system sensor histidine kinase BaeS